jgi:PKD repeat protein
MMDPLPDGCGLANYLPVVDYGLEDRFVDSVRWTLVGISGANAGVTIYSDTLRRLTDSIPVVGAGVYEFTATAYNGCATAGVTVTESFRIFESPLPGFFLDTTFVCQGETITAIDTSSGDITTRRWSVVNSTGGEVLSSTDSIATFTFEDNLPVGDYTIILTVSNPECGSLSTDLGVLVSNPPSFTLIPQPDFCDTASISLMGVYENIPLIDSVRWNIFDDRNTLLFTSDTIAPAAAPFGVGVYYVTSEAFNGCGQLTLRDTFQVFAGPVLDISVDTSFVCLDGGPTVTILNNSQGDSLDYVWGAEYISAGSGAFTIDTMIPERPTFSFQDTGRYVLMATISNPVCDPVFWSDTILVAESPKFVLDSIGDFCEEVFLTPIITYESFRIDSVVWEFPGSSLVPPRSTNFFPSDIPYRGAGTYTYSVTAFNACGSFRAEDTFVIDTIPVVDLGPTDTICIRDGLFQLPPASPPGGIWRDSLGRPGVITPDGIFDPVAAMGGVSVVEYVFTEGECEVITQKDVFVVDLAFVMVDPVELDACVSDIAFVLDNGMPGPGWYEGPGVTDSLGVMDPSSLGLGQYTLTYFYRAPGTDCIETRDFIVNVRPLPEPEISVTDSICVNVPVVMEDAGSGAVAWDWLVEDSIRYAGATITHAFRDTGLQRIQLISTSEFGCQDSISLEVYVSGPPIARFTKDTTMGCAILPVNFMDESIPFQFARWNWDFGNGETSNERNPPTVFYDQGLEDTTYYVTLEVINACGVDYFRDSVTVFPNPKARIELSQREGCTPLDVEFTNLTRGLPDRFEWYIDGVLYSTDSLAPDRSFIAPDSMNVYYDIMLVAYNECGSDTARQTIAVLPDDVRAFFTVDDQVGCAPYEVQFRNFSDPDSLVTFDWFFGDGSSSQLKDPLHVFENPSDTTIVYDVVLVADNGCGRDSISIPITVHPAPQVSFMPPPITCARDTVFFTNTSKDVTNPIWVFGDGDTLTMTENPGHVYDQPGTYTVELTAFAVGTGCPNTWTETITIRPIPVADAEADVLFGCPPLEVRMTNQSQNANFYFWDFGDGNTSVGETPQPHRYTSPGIYDITLRASDEFGCSHDSVVATIQVYEVPQINFVTEPDRQCGVPVEICFENNSMNGGDYEWNFGNGTTSTDNNPCVTYTSPGDYLITLNATNEFLCETVTEIPITIYGEPVASYVTTDSTLCLGDPVTFTSTSQEATFVQWIFSDGFTSTEPSVTRIFTELGSYGFTLIAGNESGCADTLMTGTVLEVFPSPMADFDYFERDDLLPTSIEFTDLSSADATIFGWDFGDGNSSSEMNPIHRYLSSFDKLVVHWVENDFGCTDTIEMLVDLDTLGGLFIPNVFTPQDITTAEKNIFKPKGIGLSEFYIAVYARTGQLVWESDLLDEEGSPIEAWDGTYRGEELPAGTYVWRVHRARMLNGRPWPGMADRNGVLRTTGYVTLIR